MLSSTTATPDTKRQKRMVSCVVPVMCYVEAETPRTIASGVEPHIRFHDNFGGVLPAAHFQFY
jgi:hypothetical protein